MPRKPVDTAHINLRIRESLRRKLAREAEKHRTSLNNEIRVRLEDSLKAGAVRDIETVAADLKVIDARLGLKVTLPPLEEELAQALAVTKDPKVAGLAKAWLVTRAAAKKTEEGSS
jgi:Arc-like DNA binding domain